MDEPSVLDYVKAKLTFWKKTDLRIPDPDAVPFEQAVVEAPVVEIQAAAQAEKPPSSAWLSSFPWLALAPLAAALIAQEFIEPPNRFAVIAGLLYAVSAVLAGLAVWKNALRLAEPRAQVQPADRQPDDLQAVWMVAVGGFGLALVYALVKTRTPDDSVLMDAGRAVLAVLVGVGSFWIAWLGSQSLRPQGEKEATPYSSKVVAGLVLMLLSILVLGGNRFNVINMTLWLACMVVCYGLLFRYDLKALYQRARGALQAAPVLKLSGYGVLLVLAVLVVMAFRFNNFEGLPGNMFSDHAEKLLDVRDLISGEDKIFFERNTGREMFQFYWTALVAGVFGTGLSFMSLKLGTALAGLITLYYMYRLGYELGGRWVALYAFFLAGTAYWPNIISRIGLRFPLYPFCVAPVLFYLFRGLRRQNRNDFIWGGIWLGIGLHGYTASRIVPLLVLVAFALYFLLNRPRGNSREVLTWLVAFSFAALIVVLPLFRYTLDTPEMVVYRSLTRMGTVERALPGEPLGIFLSNTWNALVMFFWDDGDVWVHSIPNRPALAVMDAALFFSGAALVLLRAVRRPNWRDALLLVSIPVLLLPSILSLAFPNENPSLNRTAGAYVPVFLIAALGMDALLRAVWQKISGKTGLVSAALVGGVLILASYSANADLFFNQYYKQYTASAWNTAEMGQVMRGFTQVVGTDETTWVIGYPHWVDTRLVGINAGFIERSPEISIAQLDKTTADPRAKLFMLNVADTAALNSLNALYPQGWSWLHKSATPGRDFMLFMAPADATFDAKSME